MVTPSYPYRHGCIRLELLPKSHHGKLCGVPKLVTEEPISLHTEHVQVDVSALSRV